MAPAKVMRDFLRDFSGTSSGTSQGLLRDFLRDFSGTSSGTSSGASHGLPQGLLRDFSRTPDQTENAFYHEKQSSHDLYHTNTSSSYLDSGHCRCRKRLVALWVKITQSESTITMWALRKIDQRWRGYEQRCPHQVHLTDSAYLSTLLYFPWTLQDPPVKSHHSADMIVMLPSQQLYGCSRLELVPVKSPVFARRPIF